MALTYCMKFKLKIRVKNKTLQQFWNGKNKGNKFCCFEIKYFSYFTFQDEIIFMCGR